MAKLQINPQGTEETIEFYLDQVKHPVAYGNKKVELMNSGMPLDEIDRYIRNTPFVMEVYYSKDQGLFLVESEPIGIIKMYNPYDGIEIFNPESGWDDEEITLG
jgi:hypothetical protein